MKSSYQRLKDKNEELKSEIVSLNADLYVIIRDPNSYDGLSAKMKHELGYRMDDEVWAGNGWQCMDTVGMWGHAKKETLFGKIKKKIKTLFT